MIARGPQRLAELPGCTQSRVTRPMRATVVGGGLGGVAAALTLAERGVSVTLIEAEPVLGGRVSAWDDQLPSGETFQMSRGFHAFFRQYYNVRALLRRVDPALSMLSPLTDYPIYGKHGAVETFAGLPTLPPFNLIALTHRTPTLTLRDLTRVDVRAALAMLAYDPARTYADYDHLSATQYLDSLRFPPAARGMLFNVFAHSFFNPEHTMSAAELLMMFHFYFTGSSEGLIFDVLNRPFSRALWEPLTSLLTQLGVQLRLGTRAQRVSATSSGGWAVETEGGERFEGEQLVLALNVPGLKRLVAHSTDLDDRSFRQSIDALDTTWPFVVWRRWLDRRAAPNRPPFVGTNELGHLDNVSLFEGLEDESAGWAGRNRGSVIELHAYGVEPEHDEAALRAELWESTLTLYPELRGANVLDERYLIRRDCPAFSTGSHALRPEVHTPWPSLTLAGDFIKLPIPSALMERATASGLLAANHLLAQEHVRGAPVYSVPQRGLLAKGLSRFKRQERVDVRKHA